MARLIDAENAIKKLEDIGGHLIYEEDGKSFCITMDALIRFINNLPTIEPVKHGKWVVEHEESIRCSEFCFNRAHIKMPMDYCPNCGADMRGE